jgi:deoxyribodipyrimidine photolyase-related protein
MSPAPHCRNLVLILGDQLDADSSALKDIDPAQDVVLMVEAFEESRHVWSHKIRTTLFLSAMRHFAAALRARGLRVDYRGLDSHGDATLADGLQAAALQHQPHAVIGVEPGDLRVTAALDGAINNLAAYAINQRATGLKCIKKRNYSGHRVLRATN